jgi:myosin heavy subunit
MTKDNFAYLKSGCDDIPRHLVDDVERYDELFEKIDGELKFSPEEQDTIWRIVAGVLHLGNVELDGGAYDVVRSTDPR